MKEGLVHVCFILDESGSMYDSTADVKGGFKKVIDEQKAVKNGGCIVSLYKFNQATTKVYLGKDVNEIDGDNLDYSAGGCTAMNDAIGTAIDEVGKWLADMDESERPEKNMIVIMTDGEENASHEYSIERVRDMIKHQTEKYDWSFVYMGTDVSDASYSNSIMGGLTGCTAMYNTRDNHEANYVLTSSLTTSWRSMTGATYSAKCKAMSSNLEEAADAITDNYEKATGKKVKGRNA